MSHFDGLFLEPDFVFPVFSAGEAVYWLHWLHDSCSLWNDMFCHMSHRVGKQFLAFFHALLLFLLLLLGLLTLVFGLEVLALLFLFPGLF